MLNRLNLRIRIYIILTTLILITLAGGIVMIGYTYRMEALLTEIINKDIVAFQAAEGLESALVNQKGFVSYYFLDGDPAWLRQLGEYRQIFNQQLNRTRALSTTEKERETIRMIASEYRDYITSKDRVIAYYKAGEREKGATLHKEVRGHFFRIFDLCEDFKSIYTKRIKETKQRSQNQAKKLRITAVIAMMVEFFLGIVLAYLLVHHILGNIRRLAREADRKEGILRTEDELKALSRSVRGLLDDVDTTHSELEKSREHLLQAEKMAMVGKLAAGMAHSIRNPFTSVKMRLFSLSRSLELSETQKEDFEVISQEIRHVDHIVQNFLEFSRPPKLKMQSISPSVAVDMAIQLLYHRLKSYDVSVKVERNGQLPNIEGDPEQLKEVLVNLIINACEAMANGGAIEIREEVFREDESPPHVLIHLIDTGPGIPREIISKIFDPFYTTKDDGTGLGLSIAVRIIQEHKGRLEVESEEGEGARFTIILPIREDSDEIGRGAAS